MTANPQSILPDRLTLADYDAILAAGNEAEQEVDHLGAMREAGNERNLFAWGALVDDGGRQVVVHLMMLGYARTPAMRIAIALEQRSITVIPPAEGWRAG